MRKSAWQNKFRNIVSKLPRNGDFQRTFVLLLAVFYGFQTNLFAERLPVKIYTSADGLGSGFVNTVTKDSRGFMWFCTRDGLSRFDGANFVTYQIGGKDSPPGIDRIFESRSGVYWINTNRGLFRFNPGDVSQPSAGIPVLSAEKVSESGRLLFEDSRGDFWALAPGGLSLLREKGGRVEFEKYDLNLPPEANSALSVHEVTEAVDGSIWFKANVGLIRLLPDRRVVYYPFEKPASVGNSTLTLDRAGRAWLSLYNALLVIKTKPAESYAAAQSVTLESLKPSSVVELQPEKNYRLPQQDGEVFQFTTHQNERLIETSFSKRILQTSNGSVWVTAENKLLEFTDGIFRLHSDKEGLPTVMGWMEEDYAGNLWIAGHVGLARIDLRGLVSYGANDGANSSRFFGINESADGTLYFSALDFYLNQFNENKLVTIRPQIPPGLSFVWSSRHAFLDSGGNWWFLTADKLYFFAAIKNFNEFENRPPTKVYTAADGLPSNSVFQMFEDAGGNIWVSTMSSNVGTGIARLEKGANEFYKFTESEGLPAGKAFSSAVEDLQGNVWFVFYDGGVARFRGGKFEYFEKTPLLDSTLPDIYLDKKGRLWIASAVRGLFRIDDPSAEQPEFVNFNTAHGLSSNNIRTITGDDFGRIYLGSARGVDRLSPDTGFVKHYSVNDGLAADFVVDSRCDKKGNLWFATNSGISRLVPLPEENSYPPRILLGGLRIAGESQTISQLGDSEIEKGELSADQNNLQIDFFGLDFRAGETLRYQYKLEGIDTDWSLPSEQRTVTFANLSPRNYRFLVRAVNAEGQTSENPAAVSFRILPPLYARWWFIALSSLIVAAIIFVFYRYRLGKLEEINLALHEAKKSEEKLSRSRAERLAELEQVRTRIATDLHDDIGSSLTQISLYGELARQREREQGKAGDSLDMITNVANELVDTMSDIVWAINPKKDHLQDLTQRMRRFAADVLTAKEIDLEFSVPAADHEIPLGANIRREVFLIFKETVNNIAKHSEAAAAKINFSLRNDFLVIAFEDNGKGFNQTEKFGENGNGDWKKFRGGNGLLNMRKRAVELGGEYEIKSDPGQGTIVMLSVPLEIKEEELVVNR